MEIRNVKGLALQIAETGQVIAAGDVVDVDDELAATLLEQPANWQPTTFVPFPILGLAPTPTRKPRRARRTPEENPR